MTNTNILIVDDDKDHAESLRQILVSAGYTVLVAHSYDGALEAINKSRVDLAFIDNKLGNRSGAELIVWLQNHYPQILCIMITAYAEVHSIMKIIKGGAYDSLLKPYNPQKLLLDMNRWSDKVRLEKEKSQIESVLKDETEKFRQLSENIQQVFWLTDIDITQIYYISKTFEKVWGRTCEELVENIGEWINWIHIEDRARVFALRDPAKIVAGKINVEYRIIRPDGSIRWIHDRGFPIYDDNGKVYRVGGIAEDITERKKIESELESYRHSLEAQVQERTGKIRELQGLYDRAINGSNTALWEWDMHADRVWWSPKFFELLGFEYNAFETSYNSFKELLHPDDREAVYDAIHKNLEQRVPYKMRYRLRTRSGQYIWFYATGETTFDETGKPVAMSGSILKLDDFE